MKPTVTVLLTGGLDSTAAAYYLAERYALDLLYVDLGFAVADEEVAAALDVADALGRPLTVVDAGGYARLVDAVTSPRTYSEAWHPGRDALLLDLAVARALAHGHERVASSHLADDAYGSAHPAFVPAFVAAATVAAYDPSRGTGAVEVVEPLRSLTKADLVAEAPPSLRTLWAWTRSCWSPGSPCDTCDKCKARAAAFASAGYPDPAKER